MSDGPFAAASAREAADDLAEAGRALEDFARTGALVRSEIERMARTGEADLERLARKLVELIAMLAAQQITTGSGGQAGGNPVNVVLNLAGTERGAQPHAQGSANQVAALVAQAARRGVRFT